MRLWLIGMMGSGKSSAGRRASEALGVPFCDTDELVEERSGRSVPQIWREHGEQGFREAETIAVRDAATREGIISTGGGVVLDPDNRALIRGPKVVWLQASPAVLAERLGGSGDRPGLVAADQSEESFLVQMLELRSPMYSELATHRIDTEGLSTDSVAGMVEAIWKG